VIAHVSAGGKLAMELKVEKARGYVPGNLRQLVMAARVSVSWFWMLRSARFVGSAISSRALVSNSVPILTS
jgi:hypothetical protein